MERNMVLQIPLPARRLDIQWVPWGFQHRAAGHDVLKVVITSNLKEAVVRVEGVVVELHAAGDRDRHSGEIVVMAIRMSLFTYV